jgi:predicted nucleic acid-binding protein
MTLAEIEEGIEGLGDTHRRRRLETWREALIMSAGARLIAVDRLIASRWGAIRARAARQRLTIAAMDALIAATAEVNQMTVVTRNVRDFEAWGGPIVNPWAIP